MRRTKSGYSADRDSLMASKVIERLTGVPVELFKTAAMIQGTEREPQARITYVLLRGVEVEEVGLIPHPLIAGVPAPRLTARSGRRRGPDRDQEARSRRRISKRFSASTISEAHLRPECNGSLACAGPPVVRLRFLQSRISRHGMRLWIKRIERDPHVIGELESEIGDSSSSELEQKVEELLATLRGGGIVAGHGKLFSESLRG